MNRTHKAARAFLTPQLSCKFFVSAYSLLLFCLLFFAYTRNNTYPFWYHSDEESKALQIIENTRNMNHPLLMLNTAACVDFMLNPHPDSIQHVTNLGRIVSAGFAAAAVVFLSLAAWNVAGFIPALLGTLLVGGHPLVFKLAHFFKEDTALLFGWSAVLLMAAMYEKRQTFFRAVVLGGLAALAVSGKYIGLLVVLGAFVFILVHKEQRIKYATAFFLSCLSVFVLVNWQVLTDMDQVNQSFAREIYQQIHYQWGRSGPLKAIFDDLGWPGGAIALIGVLFLVVRSDLRSKTLWLILLTAGGYFLILLFTGRFYDRYMLIPLVISWLFVAWTLSVLLNELSERYAMKGKLVGWLMIFSLSAARMISVYPDFFYFTGTDNRTELAHYIQSVAGPEDRVAIDRGVNIAGYYSPQRSIDGWIPPVDMFALPMWTDSTGGDMYNALLNMGVTYIAVSPYYLDLYLSADAGREEGWLYDYKWRKPFYKKLRDQAERVYYASGEKNRYLAVELALYRIEDEK